jgi:hypothetical protein
MNKKIVLNLLVTGLIGVVLHINANCVYQSCPDVLNPDQKQQRCIDPNTRGACTPPWAGINNQKGAYAASGKCSWGIYYDTLGYGWNLEADCGGGRYILHNADTCTNNINFCGPSRGLVCTNAC